MCGPSFEPDCAIALPQAMIAVMGPEAAVNAVYAKKIAMVDESERAAFVTQLQAEYAADVDIMKLASELIVDAIVPGSSLRAELISDSGSTGRAMFYRRKRNMASRSCNWTTDPAILKRIYFSNFNQG